MSLRAVIDQFKAAATPTTTMTAQSPTGGTSTTVAPPTMTAAGPVLSPPTAASINLAPAAPAPMPVAAPTTAPAAISPAPAPSVATQPAPAATAAFTAPTGAAPGSTAPASSAAALALMPPASSPSSPTGAALPAPTLQSLGAAPAPTGATGTPQVTGTGSGAVQSTALTGQEVPKTIDPTLSPALSALLAQAQAAASRAVDQPTVWDDTLAGQIKDQEKRGIDQNFTQQSDALDAELAGRGLNWSSIAGDRVVDLNTRKAQALSDVDTAIARERANALAAGRASGLAGLQSVLGQTSNIETGVQNAARSERDYTDTTANTARQQALEEMVLGHTMSMQDQAAWQAAIQQGLNYGTNGAGTAALSSAGGLNSATGSAYGGQAASDSAQLEQLAQYAMQFFGGH